MCDKELFICPQKSQTSTKTIIVNEKELRKENINDNVNFVDYLFFSYIIYQEVKDARV